MLVLVDEITITESSYIIFFISNFSVGYEARKCYVKIILRGSNNAGDVLILIYIPNLISIKCYQSTLNDIVD